MNNSRRFITTTCTFHSTSRFGKGWRVKNNNIPSPTLCFQRLRSVLLLLCCRCARFTIIAITNLFTQVFEGIRYDKFNAIIKAIQGNIPSSTFNRTF